MTQKIIHFQPTSLATVPPQDKLQKDLFKALTEGEIAPSLFPTLNLAPPTQPLQLQIVTAAAQGSRKVMEDAHFHCLLPEGYLMGIFDGHAEKGVLARYAAQLFQSSFSKFFQMHSSDFKQLFKEMCLFIHRTITQKQGGTTALVCYFNPTSHRLYVSNLGDSKAKIFRKTGNQIPGNQIQCLPVSIQRDWTSPKDENRVKQIFDAQRFGRWVQNPAKQRYFPYQVGGVNVSRSLGDLTMQIEGKTAMSQSPRTTCIQLQENDLLVMGCDGLWDFVSDQEIIDILTNSWDSSLLANLLLQYALKKSTDNISVICALVKTEMEETDDLNSTQPYEDSE